MAIPIHVIGSSHTDLVVKAEWLPMPCVTVVGGTFLMNPGGKGANQAVMAARLGSKVTLIARIGKGSFLTRRIYCLWPRSPSPVGLSLFR